VNSTSSAARFRIPVQPPVRQLLIASMSASVGSIEVILWATFRLHGFVLAAGMALIAVGVGFAVAALVRYRSLRWVVYLGPAGLTVVYRTRRRAMAWTDIASVELVSGRLLILLARDGSRPLDLPVDRTRSAQRAAAEVVREIDVRLSTRA
jgi:hypothetical protein